MPLQYDLHRLSHQHHAPYSPRFQGKMIASQQISTFNYVQQHVAIIGNDQNIATQLFNIARQAKKVTIFQQYPIPILPKNKKILSPLIRYPRIHKNKRLFNQQINRVLALHFLENEVPNVWLRRQLTANFVRSKDYFLRSDDYYFALQLEQCRLMTWPISHIGQHYIYTINDEAIACDCIIYADTVVL